MIYRPTPIAALIQASYCSRRPWQLVTELRHALTRTSAIQLAISADNTFLSLGKEKRASEQICVNKEMIDGRLHIRKKPGAKIQKKK